jgi:hypothetical protein
MPIFSRRRLQSMLDEISPFLDAHKANDLVSRINKHKDEDQVLPAEMEVALTWALSSLGKIEIEPDRWGGPRPDVYSESFISEYPCVIEIAALHDAKISGEKDMDMVSFRLAESANCAEKGIGDYLYFRFGEESIYSGRNYERRRLAPKDFEVPKLMANAIAEWIKSGRSISEPIRIVDEGLDVQIERRTDKQKRGFNVWSSMPPETHHLEKNPLFERLNKKRKEQLKGISVGTYKIFFLADVGSTLLKDIGSVIERDRTNKRVSGSQIISHFIQKYSLDVDAIVVFSAQRPSSGLSGSFSTSQRRLQWKADYFGSPSLPNRPHEIDDLLRKLPAPRYDGYNSRSLFKQGYFSPKMSGHHLTVGYLAGKGNDMSIKFSARMLLDLLASRMSESQFRSQLDGGSDQESLFKQWLDKGLTISGIEMAPRQIDNEDDYIILHFSDDPAARDLVVNLPSKLDSTANEVPKN